MRKFESLFRTKIRVQAPDLAREATLCEKSNGRAALKKRTLAATTKAICFLVLAINESVEKALVALGLRRRYVPF